ncbi:MAG: hypothetical protein QOE44_1558, partial [Solirubrobacteraceae bacterium]|nr:hypothetical protein [Solirubrobacteraceae bacterium]
RQAQVKLYTLAHDGMPAPAAAVSAAPGTAEPPAASA